jgi:hypothetical protein
MSDNVKDRKAISIKLLQIFPVSATGAVRPANTNHLPVFKIDHSR